VLGSVEAFLGRSKDQVQNLDRSQELGVFHVKPKVE